MSSESNKAIVRRFFEEVIDKGNLEIVDRTSVMHRLQDGVMVT